MKYLLNCMKGYQIFSKKLLTLIIFLSSVYAQEFSICSYAQFSSKENEVAIRKIVKENPKNAQCLLALAHYELKKSNTKQGLSLISKAYSIDSELVDSSKFSNILPIALEISNLYTQKDSDKNISKKLGDMYFEMGIYKEAINEYKEFLEDKSEDISSRLKLAISYTNRHNTKDAIEEFENIIKMDENNFFANYYLGEILYEIKNENATYYLTKAREILEKREKTDTIEYKSCTDMLGLNDATSKKGNFLR